MLAIHRLPHRIFVGNFFVYKNLHIEPFNYTIKSVCFDFGSTNVGSSVIKTVRSEGFLLHYFYRFRCHYPLITYLSLKNIQVKSSTFLPRKYQSKDFSHFHWRKKILQNSPKTLRYIGCFLCRISVCRAC